MLFSQQFCKKSVYPWVRPSNPMEPWNLTSSKQKSVLFTTCFCLYILRDLVVNNLDVFSFAVPLLVLDFVVPDFLGPTSDLSVDSPINKSKVSTFKD